MPRAGGLPSGTVTFLFTDLEGSTRLWEEHPEAMKTALARHDEILRDAVETHGGHIVKTTGDGVHAAFVDPERAIAAAVAAGRGLGGAAIEPRLSIRQGIHTGAAEVRSGDYYGSAVNRAARVMSAAHGGQILVSLATEELVRDQLSDGIGLSDLGVHQLRDLSRPEHVFQVTGPGLEPRFPPLRSLDFFRTNVPAQLTSFIGREDELAGVIDALGTARMVTITGVGGVGKTRLALQVAADALPRFSDGVWVCELAVADSPDAMMQVIAAALGARPRDGLSLEESTIEFLRPQRLLVVLDNCEHLLRPVRAFAGAVLEACPDVRLLATSREAVGLKGEQSLPLSSLSVPDTTSADEVSASEAARLFADRARVLRPTFTVDDSNAAAVADVCRRLDGIPLALELAAARVVAMTPADIAARLDERFRLLTGGRHAAVERHQTLRAAVDWSYSMLDDSERTVFDRLAVFSGTFDARAAEAVVAGADVEEWDVLDALTGLVTKSMVTADEGVSGEMRYQLLETMRQYASERLDTSEADGWRRRHAQHYATVAEELARGMRSPEETRYRSRLDADEDNLRAAVGWSMGTGRDEDVELALRIIAALSYETSLHREVGVGVWAERAVDHLDCTGSDRRADVLSAAAYSSLVRGDHERSLELALAALRDQPGPDMWSPGLAHVALCYRALATGDHADLPRLMDEGRDSLARLGNEYAAVSFAWTRASYLALLRDARAIDEAREAVRRSRALGIPSAIANSLHCLGLALSTSAPDESLAAFEEALGLLESGNDNLLGSALATIAFLKSNAGDVPAALEAIRGSVAHLDRLGDRPQLAGTVDWAVVLFRRLRERPTAAVLVGAALDGPLAAVNKYPGAFGHDPADTYLAKLERDLGSEVYRAAVARGAAMSYQEVIAFLYDELDRMIAEHATDD